MSYSINPIITNMLLTRKSRSNSLSWLLTSSAGPIFPKQYGNQTCGVIARLLPSRLTELVLALAEVLHLEPTFIDQSLQAVVGAAQADAEFLRQGALAHAWVVLHQFEHPKMGVIFDGFAATDHGRRNEMEQAFRI